MRRRSVGLFPLCQHTISQPVFFPLLEALENLIQLVRVAVLVAMT